MNRLIIDRGGWLVICDGREAVILENVGDGAYPDLRTAEIREHDDSRTHDQGTDAPGRVHSSVGPARSSVEQTDWHDQAERRFLDGLARRLDDAVGAEETTGLIVVAPPRALGMLREAFTHRVRSAVRGEISKDLVRLPISEIERRLFS